MCQAKLGRISQQHFKISVHKLCGLSGHELGDGLGAGSHLPQSGSRRGYQGAPAEAADASAVVTRVSADLRTGLPLWASEVYSAAQQGSPGGADGARCSHDTLPHGHPPFAVNRGRNQHGSTPSLWTTHWMTSADALQPLSVGRSELHSHGGGGSRKAGGGASTSRRWDTVVPACQHPLG